MNQNPDLLEPVQHGSAMFPLEYYPCVFPLGTGSLPVHWHEEFEIWVYDQWFYELRKCRGDLFS